jgi:hypothetical protein
LVYFPYRYTTESVTLTQKFSFVKCFVKHGKIYPGIVSELKVPINPVLAVES